MEPYEESKKLPKDERVKKTYGLFTATLLIVGNVVGSGIFFKSDNILIATGGNVLLGVFLFCLAAISIIFGSLSIAELASRTSKPGGLMNYADVFLSPAAGSAYGWYMTYIYVPTSNVVVSWVAGVYTCQFLGISDDLLTSTLVGFGILVFIYGLNILSAKLGGIFNNVATLVKIIPLVLIGYYGFTSGYLVPSLSDTSIPVGNAWIFSIPAIAYTFDGWIVSCSISHEIKNAKKNLPRALVIGPILILAIYLFYFVGFSALVGPHTVIQMGDDSLYYAATLLFGTTGEKIILFLIIVSIVGTVNGQTMAMMQLPYSLGIRNMTPFSTFLSRTDKHEFPANSACYSLLITIVWFYVHYFIQSHNILYNSDVSEIPVVIIYVMCIPLYLKVFHLYKQGGLSFFRGIVCPSLAILGTIIIFLGGLQNFNFVFFILICLLAIPIGWLYYKKVTLKEERHT